MTHATTTPGTPRSAVFDLFGDHLRYHGGGARTQASVELLEVSGVGEPTARIVLARMRRQDRSDRERLRRTLSWLQFGPLATTTWISAHDGSTRSSRRCRTTRRCGPTC